MANVKEAGKETLAYCTSCKMDLAHLIVAMKGDQIAKAECRTCKKTHAYKAPKGITEPPVKKSVKRAAEKAAAHAAAAETARQSHEAEWERLLGASKNQMKPYTTKSAFRLGDKLAHPTFGDGVVNKLIYPNKIEVIFKADIKVLIHAGAPQT